MQFFLTLADVIVCPDKFNFSGIYRFHLEYLSSDSNHINDTFEIEKYVSKGG